MEEVQKKKKPSWMVDEDAVRHHEEMYGREATTRYRVYIRPEEMEWTFEPLAHEGKPYGYKITLTTERGNDLEAFKTLLDPTNAEEPSYINWKMRRAMLRMTIENMISTAGTR